MAQTSSPLSPASSTSTFAAIYEHDIFLDSILENIPDMIFVKDAKDLRFIRFNKAGLELLGCRLDEMIGKNDYDIFPKVEADFFTRKDREVLDGKVLVDIPEEPIHTRHKGIRYLHTKKIPVLDAQGQPKYLLGISEDITERKKSAQILQETYDDLQARTSELTVANHELESFTYSVSHDLRAPLRAIEGFAQILREEQATKLDDEGRRLIEIIRKNTLNMSQLIDDLLAFSRLGTKCFSKFTVDMNALVSQVSTELARTQPQPVHVELQVLPEAYGDNALLRQVWQNLLSNAFKFTRGRPQPSITVGSQLENNAMTYFVRDNGVGFDMQYAGKLFGVFQRLHSMEEFEGTGVGLAIVQRVIHRHGGRVWAEAAPQHGATFFFNLPPQEETR